MAAERPRHGSSRIPQNYYDGTAEGPYDVRPRRHPEALPPQYVFARFDDSDPPPDFYDELGRVWYGGDGEPGDGGGFTLREAAEDRGTTIAEVRTHWQRSVDRCTVRLAEPLPDNPDVEIVRVWGRETMFDVIVEGQPA